MSRYSRQELFAPIGPEGQRQIRESKVLLVGCGALGTHLAEFCARAGVGELTIVDRDFVEESNLQRQSLFTEEDALKAVPKAEAARIKLAKINRDVGVRAEIADFNFRNAEILADGATLILDATDNFETRFLINDVAIKAGTPWIYSGCVGSRAVCMPVIPGKTACLSCVLEDQPTADGETCDTTGIIMPAVLQAVAWATGAALKILSGNTDALLPKMISVDTWTGERSVLDASAKREDCSTCGSRQFPFLSGERGARHTSLCGRNSVQVMPEGKFDYAAARSRIKATVENDFLLKTKVDACEVTLYKDGRALIHGTDDVTKAKATYAKLIG